MSITPAFISRWQWLSYWPASCFRYLPWSGRPCDCIGMVIAAEALNSAVEAVADRLTSNPDPLIGRAKDYGALAVALLSLSAVIVGGIVFIPYIVSLFL